MVHLVVGGRSEAGQSAIRALRTLNADAEILTTTSRSEAIEGASVLAGIDLNQADAPQRVMDAVGGRQIDQLIFTPAFGPVGFPIRTATVADARAALAFSFDPMKLLTESLRPRKTIGYSAFFWLPHSQAAYGGMAYAKLALELACERHPEQYACIRAGTFRSPATRGISLLIQRRLRDTPHAELRALGEEQSASGKKFSEFFFDFAFEAEKRAYGDRFATPHRPTDAADLERALLAILTGTMKGPIVSVIGDWQWEENRAPDLGPQFAARDELSLQV
ncbi:MAG: SDR family NAD(P)-dependent oxidoreductase [Leptospirales bacterium]|nr:SDR family NAD(P)-dependent oxidoreductase [Leptospirales bacterium]